YLAPDATRTVPQATIIGNHDVASKSYEQHFNRPNVSRDHGGGGAITSGGDYWFIDSGVLFININSNELDTDEHAEFIDEVVAEHGDEARWKVLGFHHSIYSTATHNDDADVRRLRKAITPVAAETTSISSSPATITSTIERSSWRPRASRSTGPTPESLRRRSRGRRCISH